MGDYKFSNLLDLARLPYFEVRDGNRLAVKETERIPVVDVHTHLALAYLLPMQVDLYKQHEHTEHYLPACCGIDLDVYSNKNWTPEIFNELKRDMLIRTFGPGGMRKTHTVPNLVREMDEMGVAQSVLLPIDFPVISNNARYALDAARHTDRLLSFGSVHPYDLSPADRLDAQGHRGARGIKVHPNVQRVRADHPKAMKLYKLAGERNLPILWHCGPVGLPGKMMEKADELTQVRHYERPIAENPNATFILGHSGALQAEEAIKLQQRYPNVYLELSCISLSAVRTLVAKADPDRIVFGSDWPFYHQALPLARVLIATEGEPEIRAKILHRNAGRLFGLDF